MIIFSLKNGVNEIFSNHFMTLDVFGTVFGCFILKQVSSFFSWLPKKSQIKVCENFMNSVVIKLSHRNKRNWITVRKTFLTLSFLCPLQIYITITEEASSLHRAAAAVTDSTSHLYPINHFFWLSQLDNWKPTAQVQKIWSSNVYICSISCLLLYFLTLCFCCIVYISVIEL